MKATENGNGPPQLSLLFRAPRNPIDAICDYTHLLARGLRDEGASAGVALLPSAIVPDPPPGTEALVINYNPFSWGRWGWAPELPGSLARLRSRSQRPLVAVIVHEPAVPWKGLRQTLMGAWQRTQLVALLRLADVAFVSIEPWVPLIRRWAGSGTPVNHLPVGSNLPDMRWSRRQARTRLGVEDDTRVLAFFGGRHPSRPVDHLTQAIAATSRRARRLVVLNLGAEPPDLRELNGTVETVTPGPLVPSELARLLSAADVFGAPFVDGVSSRRGTVVAAMQHALPTVSTAGPLTDPFLSESGALVLVPPDRASAFGEATADLANDADARTVLSLRARRLFEERFDWRVIARRLLDLLSDRRQAR
jgi:glycosyltransferase involved in cell wall biosynthesis